MVHFSPFLAVFRHAKVFQLLEIKGVDLPAVKNYMGHENIQTTLDYCPQGLDEQIAAFEKANNNNGDGGDSNHQAGDPQIPTITNFDDQVAKLKGLHERGILNDTAFGAAVAELLSGGKKHGK